MNKIKIFTLAFCLLILVTGCDTVASGSSNSKELNCIIEYEYTEESSFSLSSEIEYDTNLEDIKKITLVSEIFAPADDINFDEVEKECDAYENVEGVTCKAELLDKSSRLSVTYDLEKVDTDFIEKEDLVLKSYDETKLELEEKGYVCK